VLFVDADEFCTPALAREIAALLRDPGDAVGAYVAGRTYLLGRWIRRCTLYPSYQFRLLRRGHAHFRKEGHGQREEFAGRAVYLRESWRHEAFSKGIAQWVERHNAYSTDEVELLARLRRERLRVADLAAGDPIRRRRAWKIVGARTPCRPLSRFLYTYVLRGGFLDGYPGLLYCLLRVAHEIHIMAKLAERESAVSAGRQQG
jgi:hypothetical protein